MAKKGLIVTGVKAIDRKLRRLDDKVQRRVVRSAVKKGLKPVLDETLANAPVGDTGNLKANIKVRSGKSRKGVVRQEVRVGDKNMTPFYGTFVEFGTKKAGPHPFMAPAFEAKGAEARNVAEDEIMKGIAREVTKVSVRGRAGAAVKRLKKSKAGKALKRARKATTRRVKRTRKAASRTVKRTRKAASRSVKRAGRQVKRTRKSAARSLKRTRKATVKRVKRARKATVKRAKAVRKSVKKSFSRGRRRRR